MKRILSVILVLLLAGCASHPAAPVKVYSFEDGRIGAADAWAVAGHGGK